jgi:hypothetical protein
MPEWARVGRFSPEMITAIAAVVIGVGAIGVSLYETTLVRQQLKGSAWPNVEGGYSFSADAFRYFLTNTGVGPARIQHAEVSVDGEPVVDWAEFFQRLGLDVTRYVTSYVARGALPPGAVHEILVLDSDQPIDELYELQDRVRIQLCYCSVYDDCWLKRMAEDPAPVRACPDDPDRMFRN